MNPMRDLASNCKRLCAILCAILLCHTTLLAQQKRWEFEFTKEVVEMADEEEEMLFLLDLFPVEDAKHVTTRLKVIVDENTITFYVDGTKREHYSIRPDIDITRKDGNLHKVSLACTNGDFVKIEKTPKGNYNIYRVYEAKQQGKGTGKWKSISLYMDYTLPSSYSLNSFVQSIEQGSNACFYDAGKGLMASTSISVGGNAGIYVDGTFKGNGRWSGFLKKGTHHVMLKKDKHKTKAYEFLVNSSSDHQFEYPALEPITGIFSLNTTPSGAKVWVDGKYAGHTPLFIPDMLIGDHNICIEKNYFETIYTQARIEENRLTSQSHTLVSSVPFTLTSYPDGSVLFYINDDKQWHRTPYSVNLPEGDYRILVPRQYNDRGTLKQERTIRVDSLNQTYNLALYTDNNYDLATFVGIDYDMGLQALAFNFGSNPGEHFMFDFNFYKGLRPSETIYWSAHKTASQNNYDLQSFKYNHWALSLRCGPTFWCGPYLRLSPQVGLQYLRLQEKAVGENNTMESMAKGGYVSALASMRIRVALAEHWGIHLTPQYRFNLTGNAVLPETSDIIGGWVNGFSLKAGVSFYFY